MDNESLQRDEIEALCAIYGDSLNIDDREQRLFSINLSRSSTQWIKVDINFPSEYPTNDSPKYTFSAPWLMRDLKQKLIQQLDEIKRDHFGESVVYLWVERIRQFLDEIDQCQVKGSEQKENDSKHEINEKIIIYHGEPIIDRLSTFQAHCAHIESIDEIENVMKKLNQSKEISTATHFISAHRIRKVNCDHDFIEGFNDLTQPNTGSRLLQILREQNARDLVVIVTHWDGYINLGTDLFKHIQFCARDLLSKCGFLNAINQTADARKKKK